MTTTVEGDANVMRLGDGRVLVALLDKLSPDLDGGRPPNDWNKHASLGSAPLGRAYGLPDPSLPPTSAEFEQVHQNEQQGISPFLEAITKARGARQIALSDLPTLVTFRDLRDPLTVETVDPENLAASLGPAVTLESAVLEVTDDTVSHDIDNVLPWVSSLRGNLRGQVFRSDPSLQSNLEVDHFRRNGSY